MYIDSTKQKCCLHYNMVRSDEVGQMHRYLIFDRDKKWKTQAVSVAPRRSLFVSSATSKFQDISIITTSTLLLVLLRSRTQASDGCGTHEYHGDGTDRINCLPHANEEVSSHRIPMLVTRVVKEATYGNT